MLRRTSYYLTAVLAMCLMSALLVAGCSGAKTGSGLSRGGFGTITVKFAKNGGEVSAEAKGTTLVVNAAETEFTKAEIDFYQLLGEDKALWRTFTFDLTSGQTQILIENVPAPCDYWIDGRLYAGEETPAESFYAQVHVDPGVTTVATATPNPGPSPSPSPSPTPSPTPSPSPSPEPSPSPTPSPSPSPGEYDPPGNDKIISVGATSDIYHDMDVDENGKGALIYVNSAKQSILGTVFSSSSEYDIVIDKDELDLHPLITPGEEQKAQRLAISALNGIASTVCGFFGGGVSGFFSVAQIDFGTGEVVNPDPPVKSDLYYGIEKISAGRDASGRTCWAYSNSWESDDPSSDPACVYGYQNNGLNSSSGVKFSSVLGSYAYYLFDMRMNKKGQGLLAVADNENHGTVNCYLFDGDFPVEGAAPTFKFAAPFSLDDSLMEVSAAISDNCLVLLVSGYHGDDSVTYVKRYSFDPSDLSKEPEPIDESPIQILMVESDNEEVPYWGFYYPRVCINADKNVMVIAKTSEAVEPSADSIVGQAICADGKVCSPFLIGHGDPYITSTAIAVAPNRRAVISWSDDSDDGQIHVRNYPIEYNYNNEDPIKN